jgi:uncharacterized protein YcbK (DUF882 family)
MDLRPLFTRRRLLLAAGAALATPFPGTGAEPAVPADDRLRSLLAQRRSLWLVRGREQVRATWWSADGGYDRAQYLDVCWLLRDVQADRVFPMDHALLDVLAGVQAWLVRNGLDAPLEIHSGYRTHATNQKLEGAALNSRHKVGKAADITVDGVSNLKLAGMASVLGRGGTGFYPGRTFVHVDTGDARIWITPRKAG